VQPLRVELTRRLVPANHSLASKMAGALVEAGAACVNILPEVTSVYRWAGKLNEDKESLLVIKASADVVPKLEAVMRATHPYDLPEWVRFYRCPLTSELTIGAECRRWCSTWTMRSPRASTRRGCLRRHGASDPQPGDSLSDCFLTTLVCVSAYSSALFGPAGR